MKRYTTEYSFHIDGKYVAGDLKGGFIDDNVTVKDSWITHTSRVDGYSIIDNSYLQNSSYIHDANIRDMFLNKMYINSHNIHDVEDMFMYRKIGNIDYVVFAIDTEGNLRFREDNSILIKKYINDYEYNHTYIGKYDQANNTIDKIWNCNYNCPDVGNISLDEFIRKVR